MKRIFNFQKTVKEVTITLDYEDYLKLMSSLTANNRIEELKEIKETIESIEPQYIWDEI